MLLSKAQIPSYIVFLKTSLKSSYLIGINQFIQYRYKKLNKPRIFLHSEN